MKNKICNIQQALTHQLKEMYDGEKKIHKNLAFCVERVVSPLLKQEITGYIGKTNDQITKLERIFNYLMEEPYGSVNDVMFELIMHTQNVLRCTEQEPIRDVLLITSVQAICQYKISGYTAALALALELDLEKPAELLQEIISWERETTNNLAALARFELHPNQLVPAE